MKVRDLKLLAIPQHAPATVCAAGDGRMVALDLEPGEAMPSADHEQLTWLMPIAGEIELRDARGRRVLAGPASLVELEPGERPEVRGRTRARLLVMVASGPEPAKPRTDETASSAA